MALFEALVFWVAIVYLVEIITFKKALDFAHEIRVRGGKRFRDYEPFATVIVPFKGLDYKLEENIKAILDQDYKNRETLLVFDSFSDPSLDVLKKFAGKKNVRLLKRKDIATCSGKVAAQIAGVEKATGEVLAFADSDIRPTKKWLGELVRPLADSRVGVATGYRLYFPARKSFVSSVKSAWDAVGIGMMFTKRSFVWGGSFAIKREVFDRLRIKDKWATAISDDTVVTEAARKAGLKIWFSPRSLVATFDNSKWAELKEWTTRQIFFIRHFDTKTWKYAFLIYGYFNLVLLSALLSLAVGIYRPQFILPGLLLLLTQAFSIIRGKWRDKALQGIVPEYSTYFRARQPGADFFVKPLMMYNILKTRRMRSVTWRGREYDISNYKSLRLCTLCSMPCASTSHRSLL